MTIQSLRQKICDVRNCIQERALKVEGKIVRIESGFDKMGASDCMALEHYTDELRCESNGLRFAERKLNELLNSWSG